MENKRYDRKEYRLIVAFEFVGTDNGTASCESGFIRSWDLTIERILDKGQSLTNITSTSHAQDVFSTNTAF